LLQPLVENALKHGLAKLRQGGRLWVIVEKQGDELVIVVGDEGPPFAPDFQLGYGLQSIYNQLKLLYPGRHQIQFSHQPKQIEIRLQNQD
jgi:LytS/YehU family sensor histidine kinase